MNKRLLVSTLTLALFAMAFAAFGQAKRTDVIWARSTAGAQITLDGVMNEAVWAQAESIHVYYGKNSGLPGSGWFQERGVVPTDSTNATVKFLVAGNKLYVGVFCRDQSVGGGLFNQFDGLLMNLRNHNTPNRPAPPFEYFYGWVTEVWADTTLDEVGKPPGFFGFVGGKRDSVLAEGFPISQIWNAATTVLGTANDDATPDVGWVTEVEFNLDPLSFSGRTSGGYDVTRPEGDVLEFNISIYDADWQWPVDPARFSGNRAWFQGPWGNANALNVVRIYARPDVTVNSGPVPEVGPELIIRNLANLAAPVIDGKLDDPVWASAAKFDLRYGDPDLRATYPSVGPYRSGQFQPNVGGGQAAVVDPADATVSYFYSGTTLYFGIDVRDQVVTAIPSFNQFDGVNITITDRGAIQPTEHRFEVRELIARVDTNGVLTRSGYLAIDTLGSTQAALSINSGSTINDPNDIDTGYSLEFAIDLTKMGYPADLGDRVVWWGITLLDGDSFVNTADDYGNRVWFYRESGGASSPVWSYLEVATSVAERGNRALPNQFRLLGNYPNPFNPSTNIQFTMPEPGVVTLKVFNLLGQNVATVPLGLKEAGLHEATYNPEGFSSGIYLYRLEMTSAASKKQSATQHGKMVLIK